jgi:hypothetical protein
LTSSLNRRQAASNSPNVRYSANRFASVGTRPAFAIRRNVASRQATTVGTVLSQIGITTRNRDQASHAHHNTV